MRQPERNGLFHQRRSAVRQAEADREILLTQAEHRARRAEARVSELEAEVGRARRDVRALRDRFDELVQSVGTQAHEESSNGDGGRPERPAPGASLDEPARASAARILREAEAASRRRIEEAERSWAEASARVARVASWTSTIRPAMADVHERTKAIQGVLAEVPGRFAETVRLLEERAASLGEALEALDRAVTGLPD